VTFDVLLVLRSVILAPGYVPGRLGKPRLGTGSLPYEH
jgi:hypothetical protein